MDTDRLSKWVTLLANVGVLIGIALLIFEIDQNRQAIRAQTRNDIAQGAIGVISLTAENPQLADIVVRSNRGEDLSATEEYMLFSRAELIFRYFENVHYQYRLGTYDEGEFAGHMVTMREVVTNTASLIEFWCYNSSQFSDEYERAANEILGEDLCKQ